jgi:hypothetical protein
MALEYILGQDIFFLSVGVICFQGLKAHFQIRKCALFQRKNDNKIGGMVLTVGANIGVLFSRSRAHFQIWKYADFPKNSKKNRGWVVMTLGNGFRVQGTFPIMGIVAMQK